MLRRLIQRRVAKVEARQWASVAHLLEPDERPVDYINAAAPRERGLGGVVWLTDRRLIWTFVGHDGYNQIYHDDVPLSVIETVVLSDDGQGVVVVFKEPLAGDLGTSFKPRRGVPRGLPALHLELLRSCSTPAEGA